MKICRPTFLLLSFIAFISTGCNNTSPLYDVIIKNGTLISDLITKTNTIKDRKTTSEVFVWGYASREHKVQDQININNTAINTIES